MKSLLAELNMRYFNSANGFLAFYDFAEGGGSSRLRPLCIKPPPCCDGCRSDAGPVLANASRSPFTHMPAVGTSVCGALIAGNGRYALK